MLLSVVSRVGEATVGATRSLTAPGPARLEDVVGAVAGVAAFGLLLWVVPDESALKEAGRLP